MIYVNIFNISSNRQHIQVSIQTTEGYNITSIKFWKYDTFQDYSEAINLDYKLEQINHKEVFNIDLIDVAETEYFEGIYFIEFETDAPSEECSTCNNKVLSVTANLNNIKEYLLDEILSLSECGDIFTNSSCNGNKGMNIINANLLLDNLERSLTLGYYNEAINIYKTLLKILKLDENCCGQLRSYIEYAGLSFGTIGNRLVLS